MSLLMEALKKAERAKQAAQEQGGEQAPPADRALQLTPEDAAAPATESTASEVAAAEETAASTSPHPLLRDPRQGRIDFPRLELESIDDREFDLDPAPPRAARAAKVPDAVTEERGRAAARTVFEAKHAESGPTSRVPLLMGVLVALVLLGGAGYWWIQKQFGTSSLTGNLIANTGTQAVIPRRPLPMPAQPAAVKTADPAATQLSAIASPPVAAVPLQSTTPAAASTAGKDAAKDTPQEITPPAEIAAKPRVSRALPVRPRTGSKLASPAERRDAAGALVKVSPSTRVANATLDGAYHAYLANDLVAARSGYSTVLAADPDNRDALLGLAGVASRERRFDEAENLYLRLLHADPSDAYAQTGLLAIRGQADPVASESRLKTLIAAQPDAAYLHYALGNLYARSGRWNEAQQEHFRATTLDADNPDYCYNLAVSLDRIRQPKLALTHYQRALALAANRPASFDLSQLRARISELQSQ